MKAWTKVTASLPATPDDWSAWTHVFDRHGLPGTVQTDDPPTLSAYLPPGESIALPALERDLVERGATVTTEQVEEQDWAESWKQFFKPMHIGERLVVRPSWEPYDEKPGEIVIDLDPGQAFGTGDHPTTRLCLEILERMDLAGKSVADIGCGSGILSIAAMLLGAGRADATDVDPPSVESTLVNAERNSVLVSAYQGEGFEPLPPGRYDVVVSNIISAAVINLAPCAAQRTAAGGDWIVSGIIEANWPDVQEAAQAVGFSVQRADVEGDWIAALLRR
ncbi:MAG: 50S ribosomal protein L11 methyltransferase [Armatimonadetes bacterium]|nr:50S ribosomal protein L11 methyltransferase [Armatimonadota bacterium]